MTTTFNKIHRLKQQTGWTWAHFLTEIDRLPFGSLDEKTLYNLYRLPHRKPNTHVSKMINLLHERYFPDPFPEEINALMRVYNHLISCKHHHDIEKDVDDLVLFLTAQLALESDQNYLRHARINWLLGHTYFDRIPYARNNGKQQLLAEYKQTAIQHYSASVNWIEQYNQRHPQQRIAAHQLYKAHHNILACYLNGVSNHKRSQDEALLTWLQQSDYISNSKQTLKVEPFQWSIARNGLRFASLLENEADCRCFFEKLFAISPYFLDLNYSPLNTSAIVASEDFSWSVNNVLTPDYLVSFKK